MCASRPFFPLLSLRTRLDQYSDPSAALLTNSAEGPSSVSQDMHPIASPTALMWLDASRSRPSFCRPAVAPARPLAFRSSDRTALRSAGLGFPEDAATATTTRMHAQQFSMIPPAAEISLLPMVAMAERREGRVEATCLSKAETAGGRRAGPSPASVEDSKPILVSIEPRRSAIDASACWMERRAGSDIVLRGCFGRFVFFPRNSIQKGNPQRFV
mmetsp:Transcript_40263/g.78730  ORF Transcript_40263/g.78730 Transcript_40263/m.78730 type:complete len:215 (-) Transcript_40263:33-677(-)